MSLCPRPPSFFQFVAKLDKETTEARKASVFRGILRCRAEEGIRTPTILLSPAPQAGASASSATSAFRSKILNLTTVDNELPTFKASIRQEPDADHRIGFLN